MSDRMPQRHLDEGRKMALRMARAYGIDDVEDIRTIALDCAWSEWMNEKERAKCLAS